MEINCSKNFGRQSWIYQPLYHVGFSQVLSIRPSVVWTIESSIPRYRPWTTSMDGFTVVYRQVPWTTSSSSKKDLVNCIPYSCLRKLCQSFYQWFLSLSTFGRGRPLWTNWRQAQIQYPISCPFVQRVVQDKNVIYNSFTRVFASYVS